MAGENDSTPPLLAGMTLVLVHVTCVQLLPAATSIDETYDCEVGQPFGPMDPVHALLAIGVVHDCFGGQRGGGPAEAPTSSCTAPVVPVVGDEHPASPDTMSTKPTVRILRVVRRRRPESDRQCHLTTSAQNRPCLLTPPNQPRSCHSRWRSKLWLRRRRRRTRTVRPGRSSD